MREGKKVEMEESKKEEKEGGRGEGVRGMQSDDLVCFLAMAQLQLNLLDRES